MNANPSVAVVVMDHFLPTDPDTDTPLLVDALRRRGVRAEAAPWRQARIDWAGFDLAIVRSPWDYVHHLEEFRAWLERVEVKTRLLNEPALIRWNLDKRYLAELEALGIPVIPTSYHAQPRTLGAALEAHQPAAACDLAAGVVVKPSVGAGAVNTGLFHAGDPAARALAERIVATGGTAMIQPEVPELSAGGEKAIYLVDGEVTHAIAKGALLASGGGLIGGAYQERPVVVGVESDEAAFAQRALAASMAAAGVEMPLYARLDIIDSAQFGLVLLEAELFEPSLNLHLVEEVTEVLADAIMDRLV